jgi:hypothetical protein
MVCPKACKGRRADATVRLLSTHRQCRVPLFGLSSNNTAVRLRHITVNRAVTKSPLVATERLNAN